jgi:transposase
MNTILQPWQLFFLILAGWVNRRQQEVIEFYRAELEAMMKAQGNKRLLLTDAQRRLLAVKGKSLGRKTLMEMTTIVQADTILRWHRELIEPKGDSKMGRNLGRPPKDQEVVDLVLRMARENVTWGYKRIEGALHNLGYAICSSTVANILKQHGIEPVPTRKRTTSWSTFLKAHWEVFEGLDLDTITLWLKELRKSGYSYVSQNYTIRFPIVEESDDETPIPTSHTMCITHIPGTVTQPARGPPISAGAIPFISPHEIWRAA